MEISERLKVSSECSIGEAAQRSTSPMNAELIPAERLEGGTMSGHHPLLVCIPHEYILVRSHCRNLFPGIILTEFSFFLPSSTFLVFRSFFFRGTYTATHVGSFSVVPHDRGRSPAVTCRRITCRGYTHQATIILALAFLASAFTIDLFWP